MPAASLNLPARFLVLLALSSCATTPPAPAPDPPTLRETHVAQQTTPIHDPPSSEVSAAHDANAEPPETADAELARLVAATSDGPGNGEEPVPQHTRSERQRHVLAARMLAEAEIRAGAPRIVIFGLTSIDHPDVDPGTGCLYRKLGCVTAEEDPLLAKAYNGAIRRACREGRITTGSFRDRFVTEAEAGAWLRARGTVLRSGGDAVRFPRGGGEVRVPAAPSSSWVGADGVPRARFAILRPSVKERGAGDWPSLDEATALVAFRDDGKVYVVATPADAEAWKRCFVFDAHTGYHLQTLDRGRTK